MKKIKCMQIDTFKIKKKKITSFSSVQLTIVFPRGELVQSFLCYCVYYQELGEAQGGETGKSPWRKAHLLCLHKQMWSFKFCHTRIHQKGL